MQLPAAIALALAFAAPAAAGPIRVDIDVGKELRDPFLVRVTGHYASLHNGTSRHWKDALVRSGRRHFVALGPVNPLLNVGVSISVYHPEYVAERARSKKTPLLIRPVAFETFRPRTWRHYMEAGGEFSNGGPEWTLGQVLGHLQTFLQAYLPAMDAAADAAGDAALERYLPLLDELVAFALSDAPAARYSGGVRRKMEDDPRYARSVEEQVRETRAELRELLRRSHAWLSLPRERRVLVRDLVQRMRYGRTVGEELMTPFDLAELGAFLDRYAEDRAARREPEQAGSWANPENHVEYRVWVLDAPHPCSSVRILVDLSGVVPVDLGDLTHSVKARFCRHASGEWRYQRG